MSKKQSTENLTYFSDDENDTEEDGEESGAESEIDMDDIDIAEAAGESDNEGENEGEEEKQKDEDSVLMDVGDDADDDEEEEPDENYLQKFDEEINRNYILDNHPECAIHNKTEISAMVQVVRDENGNIIDDLHKTLPYLTKYERARVLGQRAKQINAGAKVFVKVPENVIDGYLIAEQELAQKRIPFIIRRPTPGGGCEYWNLRDLELIQF